MHPPGRKDVVYGKYTGLVNDLLMHDDCAWERRKAANQTVLSLRRTTQLPRSLNVTEVM
jgi:hypothetical protein